MFETLSHNLNQLQKTLQTFSEVSGYPPAKLLAVSKGHSAKAIATLYRLGQRDFGENYLQEALIKKSELLDLPISWHYIGRIQTNKTKLIAQHFDWVHSLCTSTQAMALQKARPLEKPPLNCCIQVNFTGDPQKGGIPPEAIEPLLDNCSLLQMIKVRGLMILPARNLNIQAQREPFRMLKECMERLVQKGYPLDTLSMGMSGDFKAALLEGSTLIRIGTTLFGERTK